MSNVQRGGTGATQQKRDRGRIRRVFDPQQQRHCFCVVFYVTPTLIRVKKKTFTPVHRVRVHGTHVHVLLAAVGYEKRFERDRADHILRITSDHSSVINLIDRSLLPDRNPHMLSTADLDQRDSRNVSITAVSAAGCCRRWG
jgi:hypothetical protein